METLPRAGGRRWGAWAAWASQSPSLSEHPKPNQNNTDDERERFRWGADGIRGSKYLVVEAEGEDLVAVEDLDGEVGAGGEVARVLDLAEVALPERAPDLIPPQQRRPRALRLSVHHSRAPPRPPHPTNARRAGKKTKLTWSPTINPQAGNKKLPLPLYLYTISHAIYVSLAGVGRVQGEGGGRGMNGEGGRETGVGTYSSSLAARRLSAAIVCLRCSASFLRSSFGLGWSLRRLCFRRMQPMRGGGRRVNAHAKKLVNRIKE